MAKPTYWKQLPLLALASQSPLSLCFSGHYIMSTEALARACERGCFLHMEGSTRDRYLPRRWYSKYSYRVKPHVGKLVFLDHKQPAERLWGGLQMLESSWRPPVFLKDTRHHIFFNCYFFEWYKIVNVFRFPAFKFEHHQVFRPTKVM